MIITIVRGGRGSENDDDYHNFFYMRKVLLFPLRQTGITELVIYYLFDICHTVVYVLSNSFIILIFLCYFLFLMTENDDIIVRGGVGGQKVMIVIIIDENDDDSGRPLRTINVYKT